MRAAVAAAAGRVKRSVFGIASLVFLRIVSSCLYSRVDRPRRGDQEEGTVLEGFLGCLLIIAACGLALKYTVCEVYVVMPPGIVKIHFLSAPCARSDEIEKRDGGWVGVVGRDW